MIKLQKKKHAQGVNCMFVLLVGRNYYYLLLFIFFNFNVTWIQHKNNRTADGHKNILLFQVQVYHIVDYILIFFI